MSVRVTFLGGLGEIGRNCAAIEIGGRIAVVDCGLMFPEEDMLGVDLIFPDWSWLRERADDVECVILTHGHEDHVGALAWFLRDINVPVYGTELTCALAASRVEEMGIEAEFVVLEDKEWAESGPFRFTLVPVSHSVPQGAAVAFDTDEGVIIHSGDFKLDPTPIDGRPTDLPAFATLGRHGVRLLLSDSTNAELDGYVPSERGLGRTIRDIVSAAEGRVVAACFASHIHRVQQIADAGVANGRKIAFLGRSMLRNVEIARNLGVLELDDASIVDISAVRSLPPEKVMVICTGSQGEPFAALSLMASGDHRFIKVGEGDTILISSSPIPGNEAKVSRVISGLLRRGATVYHGRNAMVHVSGHARQEELKTFLNVVRPTAFVPVHGEYRHLVAHAALAREMRVPDVHVLEDGDAIVVDGPKTIVERQAVPAGYVYLDGGDVAELSDGVLRDRRHLADDGVVIATVGIDLHTGEIVYGPDLDAHGFMEDPEAVLAKARERIVASIRDLARDGKLDHDAVTRAVRRVVAKVARSEVSKRPVVVPVVIDV